MVHVVLVVAKERHGISSVGRIGVDVVHIEVEVEAEVVLQTVLERTDIGSAPIETLFFTTPGAETKRSFRCAGFIDDLAELPPYFHHAGGTGCIVNSALCVVNGVVVPANNDHLRGLSTDFSTGHIDGAFLVVGHVDEHFQHAGGSSGVEDALFEDFTGVF